MEVTTDSFIGPYKILRVLGQGCMGIVYLGRHRVLEVEHALKLLPADFSQDQQRVQRFLKEARQTAKLWHPNIVRVIGADATDSTYYIAMEYIQGKTLESLIKSNNIDLHQAIRYTFQTALALAHAHDHGVIHRDVKPENVMIDHMDQAKLTDFGLAREMEAFRHERAGNLTEAGVILGTPYFMSPEQWAGEQIDHRTDIYALGVFLYFLLTDNYPYHGQSVAQILYRQMRGDITPLQHYLPNIDPEIAHIVNTAINIQPAKRFQSAHDMANALNQWWQNNPPFYELDLVPSSAFGNAFPRVQTQPRLRSLSGQRWPSVSQSQLSQAPSRQLLRSSTQNAFSPPPDADFTAQTTQRKLTPIAIASFQPDPSGPSETPTQPNLHPPTPPNTRPNPTPGNGNPTLYQHHLPHKQPPPSPEHAPPALTEHAKLAVERLSILWRSLLEDQDQDLQTRCLLMIWGWLQDIERSPDIFLWALKGEKGSAALGTLNAFHGKLLIGIKVLGSLYVDDQFIQDASYHAPQLLDVVKHCAALGTPLYTHERFKDAKAIPPEELLLLHNLSVRALISLSLATTHSHPLQRLRTPEPRHELKLGFSTAALLTSACALFTSPQAWDAASALADDLLALNGDVWIFTYIGPHIFPVQSSPDSPLPALDTLSSLIADLNRQPTLSQTHTKHLVTLLTDDDCWVYLRDHMYVTIARVRTILLGFCWSSFLRITQTHTPEETSL
jgi:serine/threonine protein kinase